MTPTMRSLWWWRAGTLWRRAPTPAGSARPLRRPGANLERDHRTRPIDACPGLCQMAPRGLVGAAYRAHFGRPWDAGACQLERLANGWTVGGGGEYSVCKNLSLGSSTTMPSSIKMVGGSVALPVPQAWAAEYRSSTATSMFNR